METALQQLFNGLWLGSMYALLALGYTMVYGVLRFINFAHSEVFMAGAFIGLGLASVLPDWGFGSGLLVLAGAMAGAALLGLTIEFLAYRPLRERPRNNVLITAIGVSLFLQYGGQAWLGATPRAFPQVFPFGPEGLAVAGARLPPVALLVIGSTVALVGALYWVVHRTKIGTAMRAVSFNPTAAALCGVNQDAVVVFTFAVGSALAGAGGVLWALSYSSISPTMGLLPGLKAFTAAVVGGIGNIPGAALGGLLLGLVEAFVRGTPASNLTDAIAFAVLIAVLLFKPSGLLGRAVQEKV